MRKKGNLLKSARSRTRSTSMNDLVTQSEQALSSQASIHTNTSKNSLRSNSQMTQSSAYSQNFDDYQDIIGDDIDTLFITPEEEKKIQNILEFARKGKINPGNAFEIPVRVIDPQLTESSNMRFWKFASELLYASMSIYDKRVQNMYQTTNRMFDNLIRVQGQPNQPLTEEEVEDKHRRQRGELIQMDVGDVGKVQTLSSYQIGSTNCEEAEKINIRNLRNQFLPDPLFQKRLQAFDSNSLKSLFMNVFESGKNLQISFFDETERGTQTKKEALQKIQEKLEQQMEDFEERIPRFVFSELQNFSPNLSVSPVFVEMDTFRKENIRQTIENTRFQVKDFVQQLKLFHKSTFQSNISGMGNNADSDATQTNSILSFQGENQFNFQFNSQDHTQLSQTHPTESQSIPNTIAFSARSQPLEFFDEDDENFTLMTPWQLQFKGLKLQKRVAHKSDNSRRRKGNKIVKQQTEIDFLDGKKELRSKIFVPVNNRVANKDDYVDTHLLPPSMNPYAQAQKRRKNQYKSDQLRTNKHAHPLVPQGTSFLSQQPINQQNSQHQEQADQNVINMDANYQQETMTQRTTNFDSNLVQQQHQSQGYVYRSTGIRNIREIKEKIYKRILQGRSVRLSELNINIAPSSVLIIFLHLVNENNINITSLEDQHDLEISPIIQ